MPSKNIILESLKNSLVSIWKNKSLFAFLFALQIIFFTIFSFVNYHYQTKMVESSQAIYEYLNELKFDEASITNDILQQKSILGDDPLMIGRNFNDILKNFRIYMAYVFSLLIAFLSISWALTNKFIGKINFRQLANILLRNFIILLFYLGLIFLFLFSLLNISIMQLTTESSPFFAKFVIFIMVSIILSYFMLVSLSLAGKTGLKDIVQKTLAVGVKKAHYILVVYSINIMLLSFSLFLLFYFLEKNTLILFLSIILILFGFVFGRIFTISVVDKLD